MVSTLEDRLSGSSNAIPWIPDPEKAAKYDKDSCDVNPLIGIAVDHYRRTNWNGDGEYDVLVLNVDKIGDVAVHCQATVLSNEMRQARPKPGEKVGVKWLGEVVGARQTYHAYKVVVERNVGGTFDWGDGTATPQESEQKQEWRNDPPPHDDAEAPPPTDSDIPF